MSKQALNSAEEVLLRHVPGGPHFQGLPPHRITSENFVLRPGEIGVSMTRASGGSIIAKANRLLAAPSIKSGPASRVAYAPISAIIAEGFDVIDDPLPDDASHVLIVSGASSLSDHQCRKRLVRKCFQWVPGVGATPPDDVA